MVLKKEVVVSRAQEAGVDAVTVYRVGSQAEEERFEAVEDYLTAPAVIRRYISPVRNNPAGSAWRLPATLPTDPDLRN